MDQNQPVMPHTENIVMNSIASSRSKYFWFSRCPQSTVSRHLSKYFCRNMMNEGCIFIYKNLTASECIFLTLHHLMSNKISLLIYSLGHRGKIFAEIILSGLIYHRIFHTSNPKNRKICWALFINIVDTCNFQFLTFWFDFKQWLNFKKISPKTWTFADKLVHVKLYCTISLQKIIV